MSDTPQATLAASATATAEVIASKAETPPRPASAVQTLRQGGRLLDGLLLLAFILFGVALIAAYCTRERFFFAWDWAAYHRYAVDQFHAFLRSFREGAVLLHGSMANEYNFLYTLPLQPFLWAFGTSRLAYLVGVTVVYQIPFCLAMGAIGMRLAGGRRQAAFWTAALVALLLPTTWLATFRGYPDVGGAALVALAVWVYVGDMQLRNWRRWVALGTVWAAVPLFRRHFAYDGVAFFLAVGIQTLLAFALELKNGFRPALVGLLGKSLRTVGVVAVMAFWLGTLGRDALPALTENTLDLYESFKASPLQFTQFYVGCFGCLALVLAAVGYLAGMWRFAQQRAAIAFVFLTGLLCMVVWFALPRQSGGMHHLLHAALLVVPGVALAMLSACDLPRRWLRLALAGSVVGALVLNFAAAVKPSLAIARAVDSTPVFAHNCGPVRRTDRAEVCRLLDYLRHITTPEDRIYVINAGYINHEMIHLAEVEMYTDPKLQMAEVPDVDSSHWYPAENLLDADYVIVVDPMSLYLPPEKQMSVRLPADAVKNWEISTDFTLLPEVFSFEGNQKARLYKRVRPTSLPVAVRTFEKITAAMPVWPGDQAEWIYLTQRTTTNYRRGRPYQFRLGENVPELKLLYARSAPAGGEVRGILKQMDNRCHRAKLSLAAINGEGRQSPLAESVVEPSAFSREVRIPFADCGQRHLMLTISPLAPGPSGHPGWLALENLTVVAAGAP